MFGTPILALSGLIIRFLAKVEKIGSEITTKYVFSFVVRLPKNTTVSTKILTCWKLLNTMSKMQNKNKAANIGVLFSVKVGFLRSHVAVDLWRWNIMVSEGHEHLEKKINGIKPPFWFRYFH